MYRPGYGDPFGDPMAIYQQHMQSRAGGRSRRFDEYYRCYPIVMLPGPERESANHGGKIFLPASALDKLTTLHITYPMLFELINGVKSKRTHSGVLEFIAEEGRCYLPHWIMETLELEPGDLLQVKSTDLPLGNFIKLQPQSSAFLDISDPKAVLETSFRNFSCLTLGDIFTFSYNENTYRVAVLDVKPNGDSHAISVQETDLEVDFAEPLGYAEEMARAQEAAKSQKPGTQKGTSHGLLHHQGTMAQAINYESIAPQEGVVESSAFATAGHRLVAKKGKGADSRNVAGSAAPEVQVQSANIASARRRTGPQPLRLPPGKLFFGYKLVPVRDKDDKDKTVEKSDAMRFQGQGETLRKKK